MARRDEAACRLSRSAQLRWPSLLHEACNECASSGCLLPHTWTVGICWTRWSHKRGQKSLLWLEQCDRFREARSASTLTVYQKQGNRSDACRLWMARLDQVDSVLSVRCFEDWREALCSYLLALEVWSGAEANSSLASLALKWGLLPTRTRQILQTSVRDGWCNTGKCGSRSTRDHQYRSIWRNVRIHVQLFEKGRILARIGRAMGNYLRFASCCCNLNTPKVADDTW